VTLVNYTVKYRYQQINFFVKLTRKYRTWVVQPQGLNLKKLAGPNLMVGHVI